LGCEPNDFYTFATPNPPMQPGDTVTFRYRLPTGMLHWVIVFAADARNMWSASTNIDSASKRDEWLTGGLTIPEDFQGPVTQFGFQIVATPRVASGFYVDDVSW
jgi:hypothetical protein